MTMYDGHPPGPFVRHSLLKDGRTKAQRACPDLQHPAELPRFHGPALTILTRPPHLARSSAGIPLSLADSFGFGMKAG
jgi:hypothetical protein